MELPQRMAPALEVSPWPNAVPRTQEDESSEPQAACATSLSELERLEAEIRNLEACMESNARPPLPAALALARSVVEPAEPLGAEEIAAPAQQVESSQEMDDAQRNRAFLASLLEMDNAQGFQALLSNDWPHPMVQQQQQQPSPKALASRSLSPRSHQVQEWTLVDDMGSSKVVEVSLSPKPPHGSRGTRPPRLPHLPKSLPQSAGASARSEFSHRCSSSPVKEATTVEGLASLSLNEGAEAAAGVDLLPFYDTRTLSCRMRVLMRAANAFKMREQPSPLAAPRRCELEIGPDALSNPTAELAEHEAEASARQAGVPDQELELELADLHAEISQHSDNPSRPPSRAVPGYLTVIDGSDVGDSPMWQDAWPVLPTDDQLSCSSGGQTASEELLPSYDTRTLSCRERVLLRSSTRSQGAPRSETSTQQVLKLSARADDSVDTATWFHEEQQPPPRLELREDVVQEEQRSSHYDQHEAEDEAEVAKSSEDLQLNQLEPFNSLALQEEEEAPPELDEEEVEEPQPLQAIISAEVPEEDSEGLQEAQPDESSPELAASFGAVSASPTAAQDTFDGERLLGIGGGSSSSSSKTTLKRLVQGATDLLPAYDLRTLNCRARLQRYAPRSQSPLVSPAVSTSSPLSTQSPQPQHHAEAYLVEETQKPEKDRGILAVASPALSLAVEGELPDHWKPSLEPDDDFQGTELPGEMHYVAADASALVSSTLLLAHPRREQRRRFSAHTTGLATVDEANEAEAEHLTMSEEVAEEAATEAVLEARCARMAPFLAQVMGAPNHQGDSAATVTTSLVLPACRDQSEHLVVGAKPARVEAQDAGTTASGSDSSRSQSLLFAPRPIPGVSSASTCNVKTSKPPVPPMGQHTEGASYRQQRVETTRTGGQEQAATDAPPAQEDLNVLKDSLAGLEHTGLYASHLKLSSHGYADELAAAEKKKRQQQEREMREAEARRERRHRRENGHRGSRFVDNEIARSRSVPPRNQRSSSSEAASSSTCQQSLEELRFQGVALPIIVEATSRTPANLKPPSVAHSARHRSGSPASSTSLPSLAGIDELNRRLNRGSHAQAQTAVPALEEQKYRLMGKMAMLNAMKKVSPQTPMELQMALQHLQDLRGAAAATDIGAPASMGGKRRLRQI